MAADNGRTFTLRAGATFTVELRARGRSFSEPTVSSARVLQTLARSRSGGAAEAYYRASAPGTVTIRATERPVCNRAARLACPQLVQLWQVRVRVTPRR